MDGRFLRHIILVFCLVAMAGLTGCIPEGYEQEERRSQEKKAGDIMQNYLQEHYEGAKINSTTVYDKAAQGEMQLTDYVEGVFTWENEKYGFVVNTFTEDIYTSMDYEKFAGLVMKQVLEELGIAYDNVVCDRCLVSIPVKPLAEDTENYFDGELMNLKYVLPVEINLEEYAKQFIENDTYRLNLSIACYGDKKLSEYGLGLVDINDIPGLSLLELCRVREKEDLKWAKGGAADLPVSLNEQSLSSEHSVVDLEDYMCSEVLRISNDSGQEEYREWEEWHNGELILVYCKNESFKRKLDVENETGSEYITEEFVYEPGTDFSIETERDNILITVTDDVKFKDLDNSGFMMRPGAKFFIYSTDDITEILEYDNEVEFFPVDKEASESLFWYAEDEKHVLACGIPFQADYQHQGIIYK